MSTLVQSNSQGYGLASLETGSAEIAFNSPTQAGNSVLFCITYFNAAASSGLDGVTDSQGNSYSRVAPDIIQQVGEWNAPEEEFIYDYSGLACFLATDLKSASDTLTFTFNPSVLGNCLVAIFEVSGAIAFDTSTSNLASGEGLASIATGTISPATGYFEIAGCVSCLEDAPTAVSSPWTLLNNAIWNGIAYATQSEDSCTFTLNYTNDPPEFPSLPAGAAIWSFTSTPTYSISGSVGIAGATVSWSGTSSGSVTSGSGGAYTIPGLANGSYTITPSLNGIVFSPTSRNETVNGGNISGVNFTETSGQVAAIAGFAPSFYFNQNSKGLAIWVATGSINGVTYNGQIVRLPANATTSIGINAQGQIVLGAGAGTYPIAVVATGQIVTSGNTKSSTPFGGAANLNQNQQIYYTTNNGVLSITDARPSGSFSFS